MQAQFTIKEFCNVKNLRERKRERREGRYWNYEFNEMDWEHFIGNKCLNMADLLLGIEFKHGIT